MLPLDNIYVQTVRGTSTKIMFNRQMDDALALIFQSTKPADNMFLLTIETAYCGKKLSIGDTAEIYALPVQTGPNKLKTHWINGKWLAIGFEHAADESNVSLMRSKVFLVRPAFIGDDVTSSLLMRSYLYESP